MRSKGKRSGAAKVAPSRPRKSVTQPTGRVRKPNLDKLIGYARVSTTEQAVNGISLEAQESRLLAYAAAQNLHVLRIESDNGVSGKATGNRPGLQKALRALRRGKADGLVAVKLDRLSRSTRDVLDLVAQAEREGWALHSIEERLDTSSAHGRFVTTVLAALAQMEREQGAERTRAALAELRRQGRRVSGRPPFGFRFEADELVPVAAEQAILKRMLEFHERGHGARRIATAFNEVGTLNPRTGKPWNYGTVGSILRTAARREGG